ncbi:rRNA methylase [Chlamydia pecorum MC/MarsBar]|nr:rRNA methylase [Chlamydia pecorum VR629]ETF38942.1 rRNA methylase [Chlamydia pecorum DBDeUG]ETF39618.1 rRNA methylase [Chlamydia pecorum MC/MarsBar]ETF40667.1 rRNA methylase [Chlamydia pecorum IPTaLE]UBV31632.1 rRNA methylase [Chlamydia pecorum]
MLMLERRRLLNSNIVKLSHEVFHDVVVPGDTVVDATCGRGLDSLVLARLLQGEGKLVVYDIQQEALESAQKLFMHSLTEKEASIIELKACSHEVFTETQVKLIHYNLGYLPLGNKEITTLENTTLKSLESALQAITPQGVITVVCYPGHDEGARETLAVERWAGRLDPKQWLVSIHYIVNRLKAPRLLVIRSLNC